MKIIERVVWLLISHYLGDFFLQTPFIAENKKNPFFMLIHSTTYLAPFLLLFGPLSWRHILIWISHYLIDSAKVRYNIISFNQDQALHHLLLAVFLI